MLHKTFLSTATHSLKLAEVVQMYNASVQAPASADQVAEALRDLADIYDKDTSGEVDGIMYDSDIVYHCCKQTGADSIAVATE